MTLQLKSGVVVLALITLSWASSLGQTPEQAPLPGDEHRTTASASDQPQGQPLPGIVKGVVTDPSGAVVGGARVRLTREDQSPGQEVLTGADGQFSFANLLPGPFHLTITSAGFAPQTSSGILHAGEIATVPQIALQVAETLTEVQVGVTQVEVAEEQIKVEEKQRVLGAIPNFYVSYVPDAAPLNSKQKFKLALRTVVDPFTFVVVAGAAGVAQAQNHFSGYGQGA